MWIGVCVAVVLDIVPTDLTASAVAVYFFIIQIIGGNMPLFVTPIKHALDLRAAMLICFPGFYIVGAVIFFLTLVLVRRNQGQETKDRLTNGDVKDTNDEVKELDDCCVEVDSKVTDQLNPKEAVA